MITFVRHTPTALAPQTCYGCSDVPLREEFAREDLPAVLARKHPSFDALISSPLQRCRLLAEALAQGAPLSFDARLQEMNFGAWELQTWDDIYASEEGKNWFANYLHSPCPQGESFSDMVARAHSFLQEYAQDERHLLVVTHAGFIRAALVAQRYLAPQHAFNFPLEFGHFIALKPLLRPIMFVGTGSDVGKSMLNSGFCRIFQQDGYCPAPFKAQNMSLNSYATPDDLEIGRAQAVQAEACGIPCHVDMNPILLKPTTDLHSQVVLLGKPAGLKSAKDYFRKNNRAELFEEAKQAFDRLKAKHCPLVMEGAGSISEMNLWDKDIVNMRMAQYAHAATYLVADIDRGGVFASVYGSIMLLPEEQRKLIKGVIINKFRGDVELFQEGKEIIERISGVPVVGVIPYLKDIFIEQEDSVILDSYSSGKSSAQAVKIAVLRLGSMSNFTDFNQLMRSPNIHLFYSNKAQELQKADIIILPGSKNTISDMQQLREQGLDKILLAHHHAGKGLYGICGGYQMMGEMIYDPHHIEGHRTECAGLGIFPIRTTIQKGKITRQCQFSFLQGEATGRGYEIHAGESPSAIPLCRLQNGELDGSYLSPLCWGSYIHGITDNQSVINAILSANGFEAEELEDYHDMKERNYDLLAEQLRSLVDMDAIYATLREEADV